MTVPPAWPIDTNVVSGMMRPHPEPRVVDFLESIAGDELDFSSFAAGEVVDGIGRLPSGRRRNNLADRSHAILEEAFEKGIVDWFETDAGECAQIMEEKQWRTPPFRSKDGRAAPSEITLTGRAPFRTARPIFDDHLRVALYGFGTVEAASAVCSAVAAWSSNSPGR